MKGELYRFKEGELYVITFKDHAVGIKEVMHCQVAGWLIKNAKDHIALTSWITITDDEDVRNNNYEYTTLLKNCITKVRKISL